MKGVVKLEALHTLRKYLEEKIPELRDNVIVVQTPPDQHLSFPSLAIIPGSFRFTAFQEGEVAKPTAHSLVVEVGVWSTTIQLRLACATEGTRYELEERLTDLFFQVENRPGVLLNQVTTCPQLGNILTAWDLDDADWGEEYAFSSQEWAVLTLRGSIPALALREGVYDINDLRLGITDDFQLPETSAAFDSLTHKVRVNEDGTITPL